MLYSRNIQNVFVEKIDLPFFNFLTLTFSVALVLNQPADGNKCKCKSRVFCLQLNGNVLILAFDCILSAPVCI